MVQKQQVVIVNYYYQIKPLIYLSMHADTAYVLYDDTLIHYDDSRVEQVSIETIDSQYIQVLSIIIILLLAIR